MIKNKTSYILIALICIFLSCLSLYLIINNNSVEKKYGKIKNPDNIFAVLSFVDGKLIYKSSESNGSIFYSYNVIKNKIRETGKIKNIQMSIYPANSSKYLYYNILTNSGDSMINKLYLFNIKKNSIKELKTNEETNRLVYSTYTSNCLVSLKGHSDSITSSTYLDAFYPSNNKTVKIVEDKYFNIETHEGTVIKNFSCSNNSIYALINEYKGDSFTTKLYKYSLNGQIENIIDLYKIKDIFVDEAISKFQVMGNYFYIKNVSGCSYIFKVDNNIVYPIFYSEDSLDISINCTSKDNRYYTFFQRRINDNLLVLDTQNNNISYIDLNLSESCNLIRYAYADEDNPLELIISLITEDKSKEELYYINIEDALNKAKKENISLDNIANLE